MIKNKFIGRIFDKFCVETDKTSGTSSCHFIISDVGINGVEGQTLIGIAYGPDANAEYQYDGLVKFNAEFSVVKGEETNDTDGFKQKVVFKNIEKLCL